MKWLSIITNVLLSLSALIFLVVAGGSVYPDVRDWVMSLFEAEDRRPTEMLATDKARKLAKQNLRQQIVTFDEFQPLTNTPGDLFMIGVSQNGLPKPERIRNLFSNTHSSFIGADPTYDDSYIPDTNRWKPRKLTGNFNNILIYNAATDEVAEVFQNRILVKFVQANWAKSPTHLMLFAITEDSNGDGSLSSEDNDVLFIYKISENKLIRVKHSNLDSIAVIQIFDADYVIVQCRVDRNNDGKFVPYATEDQPEEPLRYMKVDLNTGAISDLVPDEMRRRLQKRLQGEEP